MINLFRSKTVVFIIAGLLVVAAAIFLYQTRSKKDLETTGLPSPALEIPKTNPFEEVKANPFKDIKINPFE